MTNWKKFWRKQEREEEKEKCGLLATSLHYYLQGLETTCPPCVNLLFCFSEYEYEDTNPSESHWKKAVCLQFTNKIISIQFLSVTSHSGCLWVWNLRAMNIQDQFSLKLLAAFFLDCLLRKNFPFVLCLGTGMCISFLPPVASPFHLTPLFRSQVPFLSFPGFYSTKAMFLLFSHLSSNFREIKKIKYGLMP